MNVLSAEKQTAIIAALTEGCSIRAVERLTGVHRDTINDRKRIAEKEDEVIAAAKSPY